MSKYDDIINLERPKSKYPKMSIEKRAAEFSSFDALSGYDESITKANRIIDKKVELSDEEKRIINDKLIYIDKNIKNNIKVTITYYDYNNLKYISITNIVKKIDIYNYLIVLKNNIKIKIDEIMSINIWRENE